MAFFLPAKTNWSFVLFFFPKGFTATSTDMPVPPRLFACLCHRSFTEEVILGHEL